MLHLLHIIHLIMNEIVNIRLKLPKDFSIQLDRDIIDFKEVGISTSKEALIIKLAKIGRLKELKEIEKLKK
jgi:hypothetical protein